jgi:3-hydroxyisobutyrate dehydrogenase
MIDKGLDTTICDLADAPVLELTAKGAKRASSAREIAETCDLVGVCVRDDDEVREVCCGDSGFFASARPGLVIAVHSTVYPETVLELGEVAAKHGMHLLDACVTGGPMAAERAELTYMVGGADDAFARYKPAFETSAKTVVHTGPLGTATYTKICNNLLQYQAFNGVMEAFTLLRHLGVRKEVLEEVTRSNGLLNESCATYMNGVVAAKAAMVGDPNFQSYLRGRLEVAEKDLAIALREARRVGFSMPGTALVSQIMARVYRVEDPNRR